MIQVTIQGKDGQTFYLNPHIIETIRCTPDTVVTLISGKVYVLAETYDTLYQRIVEYRRSLVVLFGNDG